MPFKMIKIKNKLIAAKSKSCSKIPNSFIILAVYFTKLIMVEPAEILRALNT